jgi:hypothetical protein
LGAVVAVALPAFALARGTATTKLEATMSGKVEVPKGAPAGTGYVEVKLTGTKVCWEFKRIHGIDKGTAAHIHKGSPGKAGPVVVPFGAAFKREGCATTTAATAAAIAAHPGAYYVNVHTAKFPGGAIRGQLKLEAGEDKSQSGSDSGSGSGASGSDGGYGPKP